MFVGYQPGSDDGEKVKFHNDAVGSKGKPSPQLMTF